MNDYTPIWDTLKSIGLGPGGIAGGSAFLGWVGIVMLAIALSLGMLVNIDSNSWRPLARWQVLGARVAVLLVLVGVVSLLVSGLSYFVLTIGAFQVGIGMMGVSFGLMGILLASPMLFGETPEPVRLVWLPNAMLGLGGVGVVGFLLSLLGL